MPDKDTVGIGARTVKPNMDTPDKSNEVPKRKRRKWRGVPLGWIMESEYVRRKMGVSPETWTLLKKAGLVTGQPGTKCEFVVTDDVAAIIRANPELAERPSAERKRILKEKQRKRK